MPSMSPRTQQMQMNAGAGVDQATSMFEQGFSQMAYNVLSAKLPDIIPDVVTFKVLETDIDAGTAVGAFVLMRNDLPLYVPVVLSDNNLKPIEIVYHKGLNIFLPLTKQWLDEIDRSALASLGKGIKTPETLYSDVDIRNIVVPPITGRFSYAAWEPIILADVARVVNRESLEKTAEELRPTLLEFLGKAPNTVKTAFHRVLEKNPRLFKQAAAMYGVSALREALQPHAVKVAAKQLIGGGLWIADKDTTPIEFKRIFGDQAGEAYAGVRRKGYAAKDTRFEHNLAMKEQPYASWEEPNQPGVYTLTDAEGKDRHAFVMANPIDVMAEGTRYGRRPAVPGHNPIVDNSYYDPTPYSEANKVYPHGRPDESEYVTTRHGTRKYFAVLANGDYLEHDTLVGRHSAADSIDGGTLHKRLFETLAGTPKQGKGFFVRAKGNTFQATVPLEVKSITTDSDGVRRIKVSRAGEGWTEKTIITDPKSPYNTVWVAKNANVVYVPTDFVWVPLKERLNAHDFFTSAHDLQACVSSALASVGAKKVSIKNARARQFSIDGGPGLDKVAALKKLAFEYRLTVDDAEACLDKAAEEHTYRFWSVSVPALARVQAKFAADDEKKAPPKKKKEAPGGASDKGTGAETAGGPDDAAAQMAAMAAMQPPEPPQPTPTDLAAMEMQQHIDAEMVKLQEQKAMLAMLTQRAHEIAGGAAPMPTVQSQAMGAPAPSMNMATGAPMPPSDMPPGPSLGAQAAGAAGMPQDPSMMGGAQPPMDPSMMGGAQPPMDPSMMGGAQPPQQQQPPMAMMGPDGLDASTLEQQVNPQFLQQAAQLQSQDIFDAAAVSSLAQSPAVKELVGQYLPTLEKALDNLARVLLSLWMQEPTLKGEVGEAAFSGLEDTLRNTFRGMGDLVLKLSQGSHALDGAQSDANA